MEKLVSSNQSLQSKLKAARAELGTPLLKQLSKREQAELQRLKKDVNSLREAAAKTAVELDDATERKNSLETLLSSNLELRQQELAEQLARSRTRRLVC